MYFVAHGICLCSPFSSMDLFGRRRNVQPNWVTLGNQLDAGQSEWTD